MSTFSENYRKYFSLPYEDRKNFQETLINSANTVKNCVELLSLLDAKGGTEVRSAIIDRMNIIAQSPEDKAIAEQYKKGTNLREFGDFFTINLNFVYIFV